jgi:hypothetical protein
MVTTAYIPHAIYSLAMTSISIHLVSQKRTITEDRARVAARISILESVAKQLREGEDISLDELGRLHRLARPPDPAKKDKEVKEEIGWREMFFGPEKRSSEPEMSEYDKRDWEKSEFLMFSSVLTDAVLVVRKEIETEK